MSDPQKPASDATPPNPKKGGGWVSSPTDPPPPPLPTRRTVGKNELIREGVERSVELPDVNVMGAGVVDEETLKAINDESDAQMQSEKSSNASDGVKAEPAPVAVAPAADNEPRFCKNCGFSHAADPVDVTDSDKEVFLISLLAETPFTKTYSLFNGRLKVTLRSLAAADENIITKQLTQEVHDGRIPTFDPMMTRSLYLSRRQNLQLAASIVKIEPGHAVEIPSISDPELAKMFPEVKQGDINELVWHLEQKLFMSKGKSEALYLVILRAFVNFTQILLRLVENGNRSDFWPEIVGQA